MNGAVALGVDIGDSKHPQPNTHITTTTTAAATRCRHPHPDDSSQQHLSVLAVTQHVDSVWLDFSKGLGAPVGAVLAGSADFIDQAWRLKQQMGGSMRQSVRAPPPTPPRHP